MSGFIPEDIINRVRDSINIVDLVSRYLSLKKTGANYKALCPFHKEKTPSFSVSASRQIFKCFGCGKGGNVFHFVMEMDRVSFPEAVRTLAREANIEVPETRPSSPQQQAERDERTRLYEANQRAADFYARSLAGAAGQAAREYLRHRGISDEMVEHCRLGHAPESWDALVRAAHAAGLDANLLCKAGLALKRSDDSCYDRFRNRLMFPIFDTQERVVGFGARTLSDDEVKYLNTPETPIFSKGRNLYGLNWARPSIVDKKRVTVVEGYTDVIMAHQHGCTTVVATLGTALTREHIHVLRRFAERIDVVFDADPAGEQAAERSLELFLSEGAGDLLAAGFDVRIATIEGGKDPCDLIAEQGPDAFSQAIDNAVDVFTQKIKIASSRHDTLTIDGKTKAVDEVLGLAAVVPNAVGRQLTVDAVVRMLSDTFDIEDRVLRARFAQIERQRRSGRRQTDEATPGEASYDPTGRGVIEELVTVPDAAPSIFEELTADDFENGKLAALFEQMKEHYEANGTVNASRLLGRLEDPELASLVAGMLDRGPRPPGQNAGPDCVRALLKRRLEKKIREIVKKLEGAKTSGDENSVSELISERMRLQREVLAL